MKTTTRLWLIGILASSATAWAQSSAGGSPASPSSSPSNSANASAERPAATTPATKDTAQSPASTDAPAGDSAEIEKLLNASKPGTGAVSAAAGARATAAPTAALPPTAPAPTTSTVATTPTPAADVAATASAPTTATSGTATSPATNVRSTTATAATTNSTTASGAVGTTFTAPTPAISTTGTPPNPAGAGTEDRTMPGMSADLATGSTVADLRALALPQRSAALARVETQIENTNRVVASLPNTTPQGSATAQVDLAAAVEEVRAREAQLRSSLARAERAEGDAWNEARNRLAADYDAYLKAASRAEAAANAARAQVPAE